MIKKALVLGAGGFIGSHMVKRLKSEGYWVRGVDIKYPEFSETQADEFIIRDLSEQDNMNKIILFVNDFPFAVWDNLLASILTTLLLYVIVVTCCIWLIKKKKEYLKFSLLTLLCFVLLQSFMQWQIKNQQKL